MSNVAQKRPFSTLIDEEPNESTPPPSPLHRTLQTVLMSPAELKWCNQTIKTLKKHKRAIAFLDPVDPIQFNIPDYFDIIKRPMDLGTIEKKLKNNEYSTIEDFKEDVQLVFDNCYLYNNRGDPVCLDAKKVEEQFHKLCKKEPSVLAATKMNGQYQQSLSLRQPEPQLDPVLTTDIATSNTHLNLQTPSSIKLNASTKTITIPSQSNINPSTIKVKFSTSAHTHSSTSNDDINTSPEPFSSPTRATVELMPDDQLKRCEAIVKELKKAKYQGINWPFLNPVDAAAWGATDYYDIIKNPMDMYTYEKKLKEGQYTSEDQLVQDIRLMFRNCYAYNPPDHLVHGLGKEFEKVFEKQWAKLQSRGKKHNSSSTSSSKYAVKKQRASSDASLTINTSAHNGISDDVDISSPKMATYKDISLHDTNEDINESTPVSTASSGNTPNSSRPTILRLKLNVKPKEEEKPKPTVKVPGLALSKEPPSATTNPPKLAIGSKPTSPVKDKKADKTTPIVLHNHDKWLALAKKPSTDAKPLPPSSQPHTSTPNIKKVVSPVKQKESAHPAPSVPTPVAPTFDINDIYNKIHNEKKLKEQQKREEQEKWERNERIRLEKEKAQSEERMKQIREFNQHMQIQRQKDTHDRLQELNAYKIDISKQKMKFSKYEAQYMARDQDWREIYTWQRDSIDYRHIPVPGFVKRAPITISDLRKRLLSKCVRLENSKTCNQVQDIEDGSDMEVE